LLPSNQIGSTIQEELYHNSLQLNDPNLTLRDKLTHLIAIISLTDLNIGSLVIIGVKQKRVHEICKLIFLSSFLYITVVDTS
jgi:hypothetical protein